MPEPATTAEITVNDRPAFAVPTGQSLLMALQTHNIFVPSACGGHGLCGLCRVQVLSGYGGPARNSPEQSRTGASNALSPREEEHLSASERRAGQRLACQVKVERDLRLAIPEDFFHAREYKAEVIALKDLTPDIRGITMQLKSPPDMDFKAGQYIQFRIPAYATGRRITYRAYSLASPPAQRGVLELEVKQVLNGIGTTYVFKYLKLHDQVVFHGPYGDFFLRESDRLAVLVAGGSGMAPMRSILLDMRDRKVGRRVRYFYGARARRDLLLLDELPTLEQTLPDFQFIPALSAPLPEDQWRGETGLISDVLARRLEEHFPGEAYLCGSPAMIQACIKVLREKGVSDNLIFYDAFA
ncbi:MAG: 2Fe-2S iron-sulfur cluster binding domain-containing protein [Lentisphaerae bacterium]|nr:2Fe-2S iron-sulfur cluster binding domain-containing protein [Lentisphaerota bacterium]